jgi:CHASE3 domain sensor protein
MEDLTNIWNADDELNVEQLMNYVKGKSAGEEEHTVEKKMAESSFVNDAVEGLQNFSSTEKVNSYVQQINEQMHQRLAEKKQGRKNNIKSLSWEIIAVIVIILLCLIGYIVIQMMNK